MRDGIFCSLSRLLPFMKMHKLTQKLRKCYANSVGGILQCFRWLDDDECNS